MIEIQVLFQMLGKGVEGFLNLVIVGGIIDAAVAQGGEEGMAKIIGGEKSVQV